jgi:imidazolonepropionase-like amidohydrolase
VAAHVESDEGGRNAVLAGVDSVEHGHGLTDDTISLMLDRGTTLDPTILSDKAIVEAPPDAGIPQFVVDKCKPLHQALLDTLEIAFRRGVIITAGNDGGAPLVHIGDMAGELAHYVALGMHPRDAIASATINTGRLFRLEQTGYVDTGWVADLIAVRGDPLTDIAALRGPAFVMARGVIAVEPG